MPNSAGLQMWLIVLIVVMLIGAFLIRRAGQELRDELKRGPGGKGPMLTREQVEAIRAHGLAKPEDLFKMSPKEQQMLASMAVAMSGAGRGPGQGGGTRR